MYYRIEANPDNIGIVLETQSSLNPAKHSALHDNTEWQLLLMLVEKSLSTGFPLSKVCQVAVEENPAIRALLPGIWDVLFERARPSGVPFKRTDCAFFFNDIENSLNFRKTYLGSRKGQLCSVEIVEEVFTMKADMNWYVSINEATATALEVIDAFGKYWSGEMTSDPAIEVLFVGKYILNPIK